MLVCHQVSMAVFLPWVAFALHSTGCARLHVGPVEHALCGRPRLSDSATCIKVSAFNKWFWQGP